MWYKVLKVDKNATEEQIENAYRTLMQNPKISIDMDQTLKIREAYKEGMRQNKGIVVQEVSPCYQNDNSKVTSFVSDVYTKYKFLKLFVILSVVIVALFLSAYDYIEQTFFTDDDEEKIVYNSGIANCIAGNRIDDSKFEDVKLYLIEKNYVIETETEEDFMAIKTIDDVNVMVKVKKDYTISCEMSVYKQLDTTYKNLPAVLVDNVSFRWKNINEFEIDVNIFISEPVITSDAIANIDFNEVDDTREDFNFYFNKSYYENEVFADEIYEDKYFMLIDLLKAEFELLNG